MKVNECSTFYGIKGQERLASDAEDVVLALMEDDNYSDFPIKVLAFEPRKPFKNPESFAKQMLDGIFEELDEEYADPDGDNTEVTERLKEASLAFVKILEEEYPVWMCEPTGEVIEFPEEDAKKIANI